MAKSRRAKGVHLTKVTKKAGMVRKVETVDKVRERIGRNRFVHVVEISHCKTTVLQKLRETLGPEGHLYLNKNRVMQVALGLDEQSSFLPELHKLSPLLKGPAGIMCTDLDKQQIENAFERFKEDTHAVSGDVAKETVVLAAGKEALSAFTFSMDPYFRKLGLPTILKDSKIHLLADHIVCTEGDQLDANQAQLLKLLGRKNNRSELLFKATYDRLDENNPRIVIHADQTTHTA